MEATATHCVELIELLPATRTDKHPGIRWQPAADEPGRGVLTVTVSRKDTAYAVTEFACDLDGRAFRLEKLTVGTDREESAYNVFVSTQRGHDSCDCKGFCRHGHCKHISAVVNGLMFNDWI